MRLLLSMLCIMLFFSLNAQINVKTNGTRSAAIQIVGAVTVNTPTNFTFTAIFLDYTSRFTPIEVEVGDIVWMDCERFEVTNRGTISDNRVDLTVEALTVTSGVPRVLGAIVDGDTNEIPYVPRASEATKACMSDYYQQRTSERIDSNANGLNNISLIPDSISYDFDRPILRVHEVGDNIGGDNLADYFNFMYFSPPTISLSQSPSTSLFEIGTSTNITYNTSVSNPGGATLSNGSFFLVSPSNGLESFGSSTSVSRQITFTPLQTPVDTFDSYIYQFRSSQDWSGSGESGTATSNTRTIRAVYPVFHGVIPIADTAAVYSDVYGSSLNKLVTNEGDKTIVFDFAGTDGIAVYGFPSNWSDTTIDQIFDPNNLNATGGFIRRTDITVTSTGLVNNYTSVPYIFYVANGPSTYNSATYQFNQ